MRAYLDIDGVLTNFVQPVGCIHGIFDLVKEWDERTEARGLKVPCYDIAKILGITDEELWRRIGLFGEPFWRTLPLLPWAIELYQEIRSVAGEITLITSPSLDSACVKGKVEWIDRQWWIEDKRAYIITPAKNKGLLANPNAVLIDDSERNCSSFIRSGGKGILFPQPWNSGRCTVGGDVVAYVAGRLVTIMEEANEH